MKRGRTAPSVASVPAKRVKSRNVSSELYGKHSILIKQVNDHPYMSPNDRECMQNFEDRPYQLAAAKEITEKLLAGEGNNGNVALIAPGRSGKTIIGKMVARRLCAAAQTMQDTEGSTLVLYAKQHVDKTQAMDIGASFDVAFSTSTAFKDAIKQEIWKKGTATVMLADRGLSNILDTEVVSNDGKVYHFRDLDAEDFQDAKKLKESFKDKKLPYLVELIKELNIRNVLIICDEFHNLMKTSNDNRVRLLANNKKMSMMRDGPCKFNMFVLGMSATPATTDTVNCSHSRFYANKKLFDTLEPLPADHPKIDAEELNAIEAGVYVRYDGATVTSSLQSWAGFDGNGIRNERVNRTRCIQDPTNPATLGQVAKMCVMNAVIPAKSTDNGWEAVSIDLECKDGTSIEYTSRVPSKAKANPNKIYLTSSGLSVAMRAYLSDMDASLFLQGRVKGHLLAHANPISPRRASMRAVTEVHSHASGRVTATFQKTTHFQTVMLAVDSPKNMKMTMSRAAAAELSQEPGYKSTVYDLVDMPAEVMNKILREEVAPAIKEDKTQVIILVRSVDVEGMSEFSKYVTMTVFCGYNRDRLTQSLNRMARQPAPILGMIVPMADVGYIAVSACSDLSSNVVSDTHSSVDSVLALPAEDECHKLFLSLRSNDRAAASRFARHLFILSNDKKKKPIKVEDECKNIRFTNVHGHTYKSLCEGFNHLYSERTLYVRPDGNSKLWGDTFDDYLEMIAGLCNKPDDEGDE